MSEERPSGFQLRDGVADRYETFVAPLMRPFVEVLMEAVVRPGQKVLDVACGTGFATRAAAMVVGSGGSVDGIDINPGMIDTAQRNSVHNHGTIGWHTGSALDLPFDDGFFDVVVCQQGVQFFPSPTNGLLEMRRVTRTGGTLGATVWAPPSLSPYLYALTMLSERTPMTPEELHRSTRADADEVVHGWATDAGWHDVLVTSVERLVSLPTLRTQIVNHLSALPWSGPFFALSPNDQVATVDRMLEGLHTYVQPDGTAAIPTTTYLLTGRA